MFLCYNHRMQKLTLIITFVFSLTVFSSANSAEWTKVSEDVNGNTFYVDLMRIRNFYGYVYYWMLTDYKVPTEAGHSSTEIYYKGDCELFRVKPSIFVNHIQPMARDIGENSPPTLLAWMYAYPKSPLESALKFICKYAF